MVTHSGKSSPWSFVLVDVDLWEGIWEYVPKPLPRVTEAPQVRELLCADLRVAIIRALGARKGARKRDFLGADIQQWKTLLPGDRELSRRWGWPRGTVIKFLAGLSVEDIRPWDEKKEEG